MIETYLVDLLTAIADRAENDIDYVIPGYTHLQRGQVKMPPRATNEETRIFHFADLLTLLPQPVRWSHWMLSYGSFFMNDLERLREVIKHVNRSPLGCGALSGNAFGIDREAMAKELGFDGLIPNSMSAVGDRDFILETMQWGSSLMLHISRWSEDLIVYGTTEFGFVRLSDAYTTGSSLMPQKKNSMLLSSLAFL